MSNEISNMFDNLSSAPTEAAPVATSSISSDSLFDSLEASSSNIPEEKAPVEEKVTQPVVKESKVKKEVEAEVEEAPVEEPKDEVSIEEKMLKESLKSDEEKAAEVEAAKNEVKKLKVKVDKDFQEIPETATIKMKIDGKWEVKTLAEIRDIAAGNIGLEKRLNDVKKEHDSVKMTQKAIKEAEDKVKGGTKRIADAWAKSAISGIIQMAEEAGVEDVASYAETIKAQFKKEILEEMNMSPQELELKKREDSVKAQEESIELKRRSKEQEEYLVSLENETREVLEALKIDVDDFERGYHSLLQHNKNLDTASLTPQQVGQWIQLEKRGNFIMDQLIELKPELATNYELIADITNKSLEFKLSDEAVGKLLKEQYGNRVLDRGVIAVNEKLKENKEQQNSKQSESHKESAPKSNKKISLETLWD